MCLSACLYGAITYGPFRPCCAAELQSNLNHHRPDTRTDWTSEVSIEQLLLISFSNEKYMMNLRVSLGADTWACVLHAL